MDKHQLSQPTCHFLALPSELRIRIYEHIFTSDHPEKYFNSLLFIGAKHERLTKHQRRPPMTSEGLLLTCKQIEHEARPFSDASHQFNIQIRTTRSTSLPPPLIQPPEWFKRIRWLDELVLVFDLPGLGDVEWIFDQLSLILEAFDGSPECAKCWDETECTIGWNVDPIFSREDHLEVALAVTKRMQAIERTAELSVAERILYSKLWVEVKRVICRSSDQKDANEVLRQHLGDGFDEKRLAWASSA